MWNAAIHTKTDSQLRTKLNGTFNIPGAPQYPINGYTAATGVNTSGYLLIGNNTPTQLGGLIYDTKGAFSMLHLNGAQNVFTQEFGYRPWMKTGVTFTDNTDLLYMGVRSLPTI